MKTIDLELAKELQSVCKEKNATMPRAFFYHYKTSGGYEISCMRDEWEAISPAYTLDELLEILPKKITVNKFLYCPVLQVYPALYIVVYQTIETHNAVKKGESPFYPKEAIGQDSNPANAACKLLIHLIKKGWIE